MTLVGAGHGAGGGGSALAGEINELDQALQDLGAETSDAEVRVDLAADVLFDFDAAELKPAAEGSLRPLVTVLESYADAEVSIESHTDSKGDEAYNQSLSERRAESVKAWMVANAGIDAARVQTIGLGETRPVAHNTRPDGSDDPEGRQKNRRVAIIIRK